MSTPATRIVDLTLSLVIIIVGGHIIYSSIYPYMHDKKQVFNILLNLEYCIIKTKSLNMNTKTFYVVLYSMEVSKLNIYKSLIKINIK